MLSTSVRWLVAASGRDDVAELLDRLGVEAEPAEPSFVDAASVYEVVEEIVADGDDGLAFRAASSLDLDSYGALGLAFKTSPDLRTALGRVARYGELVSDAIRYELHHRDDGGASFALTGRPPSRVGISVVNEAVVAGTLSFCRQAVAPAELPAPASVSFVHAAPSSPKRYEEWFGCPVTFGASADALVLDSDFLAVPTRLADASLFGYLSARLDEQLRDVTQRMGVESAVRRVLSDGLSDGVPSMGVVAGRLTMSERTLRRRLAEEGLRYDEIVAAVRTELATSLLSNTNYPLVDVAFLTGYAEQSSFQRAYKRQTGRTPLEVRQSAR